MGGSCGSDGPAPEALGGGGGGVAGFAGGGGGAAGVVLAATGGGGGGGVASCFFGAVDFPEETPSFTMATFVPGVTVSPTFATICSRYGRQVKKCITNLQLT